jgi:ATP-binding cassette subfamily C protein CydCD
MGAAITGRVLGADPRGRRLLYGAVGLGALAAALQVAQLALLSVAIAGVFLRGMALAAALPLLAAALGLLLARAACLWGQELLAQRAASATRLALRGRLLAHLAALGPAYTARTRSGELAHTLGEGVEALDEYVAQYLPARNLAALVPALALLAVLVIDPWSTLVLLFAGPLLVALLALIGGRTRELSARREAELSWMSAFFLDIVQGLGTLKLFGRSREQAANIEAISRHFGRATMQVLTVAFQNSLVLEWGSTAATALVAIEVSFRLSAGAMPFEQALAVLLLTPEFFAPLRQLAARHHAGSAGAAAAERIFALLDTPAPAATPADGRADAPPRPAPPRPLPGAAAPFPSSPARAGSSAGLPARRAPALTLDRVSFAYDGGRRPALRGLSLQLPAGATTALLGPSGAGKSTVAALLLRFVAPDSGAILADGADLAALPLDAWRRQVAWVPQRPHLFQRSAAENIRLARPGATDAEVEAAARLAGAHEFIAALPQGYATPLGERAARLSGGQRRRIAIARAFLKGAPLLILDEPTADLDRDSAAQIAEALARLGAGRTVLLITHRPELARGADQLVELHAGAARALVGRGGRFALTPQPPLPERERGTRAHQNAALRLLPLLPLREKGAGGMRARKRIRTRSPELWVMHSPERERGSRAHQDAEATPRGKMLSSAEAPLPPGERGGRGGEVKRPPAATLGRLLGLIAPYRWWVALGIALSAGAAASGVGLMAMSAYLIARAALAAEFAPLALLIVGVRFFALGRAALRYAERYVTHLTTFRILTGLRVWLYRAVEPLAPAGLAGLHSGDVVTRLGADLTTLEQFYLRVVTPPLAAALTAAGACALLGAFDWRLAAALACLLLLAGVALPLVALRLGRGPARAIVGLRARLQALLVDAAQGLPDQLLADGAAAQQAEVRAVSRQICGAQERLALLRGAGSGLTALAAGAAALAVLLIATPLVAAGRLDGVYLALLALTATAAFEVVQPLAQALQLLSAHEAAARRLFELIDAPPPVREPAAPLPPPTGFDLEVRGLTFGYGAGAAPALAGLSFAVPQGGHARIVGPSGAGKSTLVSLLLRFWDYEQGEIRLGGHDLRAYRADDVRRLIGAVTQESHLFHTTLRENLLLANPDASDADLAAACATAELGELLARLPDGLDTIVGDDGVALSGGERQRVAIARVVLKGAPILVLDEATAHLDAETARRVRANLDAFAAGRTVLEVAHERDAGGDGGELVRLGEPEGAASIFGSGATHSLR